QHVRTRRGVVDHGRARDPDRTLDGELHGIDDHRSGAGAVADQRAARLQTVERGLQCVLADRVVDHRHTLAAGDLAYAFGDVFARRHDGVGAAVRTGDCRLFVGADGADHGDADRARPLTGYQADAAGRRMVQNGLAAFERVDLAEQILC